MSEQTTNIENLFLKRFDFVSALTTPFWSYAIALRIWGQYWGLAMLQNLRAQIFACSSASPALFSNDCRTPGCAAAKTEFLS